MQGKPTHELNIVLGGIDGGDCFENWLIGSVTRASTTGGSVMKSWYALDKS